MKKRALAVAVLSALALVSCDVDVKNPVVTVNDSESLTVDTDSVTELKIGHNVGSISLSYGEGEKAEIQVNYRYQGFSQKVVDEIGEHIACKAETEDDKLVISIIDKESGKPFSYWKNNNSKASEVTVDLDVKLPKKFDKFDVASDVGSITADSLNGTFDVRCDVGNIEMTSVELLGDSEIVSDVGDISLGIEKVGECEVKLSSDVGNISIDTGTLKYESDDEGSKPVGAKKEIVIDGKCNMKLECDVGEVTIGQEE